MTKPANKQATEKPKAASQIAALQVLSQQAAAWLLSRPPVWLRDRSHEIQRNDDGSYGARELVRYAARLGVEAAELPDREIEGLLQFAETTLLDGTSAATAAMLADIRQRHGAGGCVAIVETLLAELTSLADTWDEPLKPAPTVELIRAECEAAAAKRISELPLWNAERERRVVNVCPECDKYRWGRSWIAGVVPPTHKPQLSSTCPDCAAAAAKKSKR